MEDTLIPVTYQGISIVSIFLYSGWSGVIALGVMFFYSIPMGIKGRKNPEKRSAFILKADDVCKFLLAVFVMFTATATVDQFYPSAGMDDRCFQVYKKVTSIASSAFFTAMAIAVTRLIKILLLGKKQPQCEYPLP